MRGPLAGTRIIDLSAIIAGPMATQLLADQGASVIKVEPIGVGDTVRYLGPRRAGQSAMFLATNRNKRAIALNLKDERARAVLLDLVRGADVFVQNFRPGAVDRMKVGPSHVQAVNERLIYVSMSGFGQTGPYATRRVYDPVIQAVSGFCDAQQDGASGTPRLIQTIACDKVTALTAAQAITAALLARANGAGFQHVTLNMLDAAIAFLWPDAFYAETLIGEGVSEAPDLAKFYRIHKTKDGFVTVIAVSDGEFRALAKALGRDELSEDGRFKEIGVRSQNAVVLNEIIADILATMTTAEVTDRLTANDVPHGRVNRRGEVAGDPQVIANETLIETVHPIAGRMRAPRAAARFSTQDEIPMEPAPAIGADTDAILTELGRTPGEIADLRAAKAVA